MVSVVGMVTMESVSGTRRACGGRKGVEKEGECDRDKGGEGGIEKYAKDLDSCLWHVQTTE